nr:uncharacterized protein LOC105474789 [Macaca nemestrina]
MVKSCTSEVVVGTSFAVHQSIWFAAVYFTITQRAAAPPRIPGRSSCRAPCGWRSGRPAVEERVQRSPDSEQGRSLAVLARGDGDICVDSPFNTRDVPGTGPGRRWPQGCEDGDEVPQHLGWPSGSEAVLRTGEIWTLRHKKGELHVDGKAEIQMMQLQAMECQRFPGNPQMLGKRHGAVSPSQPPEGTNTADSLISAFCPPDWETINFWFSRS